MRDRVRTGAALLGSVAAAGSLAAAPRTLSFDDRVAFELRIERLYDERRSWPEGNGPKPRFEERVDRAALARRVEGYLRRSAALDAHFGRPITAADLGREVKRMAASTKDPEMLRQLFAILGDDPYLVAECLGRRALAPRLFAQAYVRDVGIHAARRAEAEALRARLTPESFRELGGDRLVRVERRRDHVPRCGASLAAIGSIEETDDAFVIRLLSDSLQEDAIRIAKDAPESWLEEVGAFSGFREPAIDRSLLAPVVVTGGSTDFHQEMPYARESHTAVWTGTEMIVWGGNGVLSQIGGRYDPVTDTWLLMADAGAPSPRYGHSAVWTGREMIVWGGGADFRAGACSWFQTFDSGGRYDPILDSWSSVPSSGTTDGRAFHAAVWTGNEMVVWGGMWATYPQNVGLLDTGSRYDPKLDRWTSISTTGAPSARGSHSGIWTGSELVVWGGKPGGATGGRYQPASDTWAPVATASAPPGSQGHSAVWTGAEMIVWGGKSGATPTNAGGRYDPVSDTWTATSTGSGAPTPREGHTSVWTGIRMIVWGGGSATGGLYDPAADAWSATSSGSGTPTASSDHTAVWTGLEMIVWGGGAGGSDSGGRYDPATDTWRPTWRKWEPRFEGTAVWTGAEMIVWGGTDSQANTGSRYDVATDAWTPISTGAGAPQARMRHTAVWTGAEMVVWGGAGPGALSSGGRYDPVADSWQPTSTGTGCPSARWLHTAEWTGTEMIVWGGTGATSTNTGGRYDPALDVWVPTSTRGAPAARVEHGSVWTGSEMVVWGGVASGGADLGDGGRYDPVSDAWRPMAMAGAPGPRRTPTAVFTGPEMVVWGGSSSGVELGTGGRYDVAADSWRPTSTASGAPAARVGHSTVWTGSEMIVWGGLVRETSWPYDLVSTNDGARYDPIADSWQATAYGSGLPLARRGRAAVWDGVGMLVWGGGVPGGGRYDPARDSWSWPWPSPPVLGADVLAGKSSGPSYPYAASILPFRADGRRTPKGVQAFPALLSHGVEPGAGDVLAGGADEILAGPGPGPGFPADVRGFDADGVALAGLSFGAYGTADRGVKVAAGAIDSRTEILTGPGPSPVYGPHVRAFRYDGTAASPIAKVSFYAYGTLRYGVNPAAADLERDGFAEIVTGAGPGQVFGPHVRGFDYDGVGLVAMPKVSFYAYATPRYGVEVGGADVDGDGDGAILTGPGPSLQFASHLRAFDVSGGVVPIARINAFVFPGARHGVTVAGGDVESDGFDEIACGAGPDPLSGSRLAAFDDDGTGLRPVLPLTRDVFGLAYGLQVAAGALGR